MFSLSEFENPTETVRLTVSLPPPSDRRSNEQSIPIHLHLGLAVSLTFLNLLFFFTGVLANVGGNVGCVLVGACLHYALLSSFTWMGVEVFHTFWLVYMVFSPSPKPYVWNLVGFGKCVKVKLCRGE